MSESTKLPIAGPTTVRRNFQKPEGLDRATGTIKVHSIFATIQGEGPFSGSPAVFVRLAGCNLDCWFCDTEYTSRIEISILAAVRRVQHAAAELGGGRTPLVVITGGEPFRQDALVQFIRELNGEGFLRVQIETNGTRYLDLRGLSATVVCSPKTQRIHPLMWAQISSLKYVVEAGKVDPVDGLPTEAVGPKYGRPARPPETWHRPIYVQPLDSHVRDRNQDNHREAVASCLKFGYTLCIQVHKVVELP